MNVTSPGILPWSPQAESRFLPFSQRTRTLSELAQLLDGGAKASASFGPKHLPSECVAFIICHFECCLSHKQQACYVPVSFLKVPGLDVL